MSERSYDLDKMLDRLDNLEARAEHAWTTAINWNGDTVKRLDKAETTISNLHHDSVTTHSLNAVEAQIDLLNARIRDINKSFAEQLGAVSTNLGQRLAEVESVCAKLKHLRIEEPAITSDGFGGLNIRPGTEAFDRAIAAGLGISQDALKAARADCAKHIPGSDAPSEPARFGGWHLEHGKVVPNEGPLIAEAEKLRRERDGWRDEANEREASMADMGKRNEELRVEVQELRNLLATYDNPENDMTPFQHPAFERGYNRGTAVAVQLRAERDALQAGFCDMWDTLDWMHTCGQAGRSVWDMLDRLRPLAKRPQPVVDSECKETLATEPVTASPAVTKEPQTDNTPHPTT